MQKSKDGGPSRAPKKSVSRPNSVDQHEFASYAGDRHLSGSPASWTTPGGQTLFAYAGHHYSSAQPGGKHFGIGCHPGHTGLK